MPEYLDREIAIDIPWWKDLKVHLSDIQYLLDEFGPVQEWTKDSTDIRNYGNSDTNDVSVSMDVDGYVEGLDARLDIRQINGVVFRAILDFSEQNGCVIMDYKGRLIEPLQDVLAEAIYQSNANKFLNDPKGFLENLSTEE